MIIALLVVGLVHPPQTDWDLYEWCRDNLGKGNSYCCTMAGGIVPVTGECYDNNSDQCVGPYPCQISAIPHQEP